VFQPNAAHAIAGVDATTTSSPTVLAGSSRAFVAGGIACAGGTAFRSRPILDCFAVVKVSERPNLPVYANGRPQGRTNARGEMVATELNAFYDNNVSFRPQHLPMNYQYPTNRQTISPHNRSGSAISFRIKAVQAVYGSLVRERDGKREPLEMRELKVTRGERRFDSFTARRGEFYFEDLEPGDYTLHVQGDRPCTATIRVQKTDQPFADFGAVPCN
jgi:outer membrane usher protein